MARKRVIYQSESLFVAPTGDWVGNTGVASVSGSAGSPAVPGSGVQVHRVQSINYGFDVPRQDVNEFGKLARIDQVILESPTVSLDFTYYPETGVNERALGLFLSPASSGTAGSSQVSALKTMLNGKTDVKSYFIRTVAEGSDEIGKYSDDSAQESIIAIGNASVTSYSFEASVGGFPTASVNAEGLNINILADPSALNATGNKAATVNPETGANADDDFVLETSTAGRTDTNTNNQLGDRIPSALRPGDIQFTDAFLTDNVEGGTAGLFKGWDVSELKIQSVSASLDLGREDLMKLGSKFAFSKEVQYPVTCSMTVEANVSDMLNFDLATLIGADTDTYTAGFWIKNPDSATGKQAMKILIKGAKLDSESLSSSIGDNKSVTFNFTCQVGGPEDTANGLFIQGGDAL
jgi:hypothetical protein